VNATVRDVGFFSVRASAAKDAMDVIVVGGSRLVVGGSRLVVDGRRLVVECRALGDVGVALDLRVV